MVIRRLGNCAPLALPRYAPFPFIHKLQSYINTTLYPKH